VTNAVYHLLYGRADGHEEASLSIFRLSVIDGFRLYDVPSCSCFQNLCSCFGDSAHAFSPSIKCQVRDSSALIASHGLDRRPFPLFLRFPSAFPSPPRLASKSSQTCRLLLRLGSHTECWAQMTARYACMPVSLSYHLSLSRLALRFSCSFSRSVLQAPLVSGLSRTASSKFSSQLRFPCLNFLLKPWRSEKQRRS
jgi:hypothetical protein